MSGQNKKILIVEDELPTLKILTDRFREEAFKVLEAKDGKIGLRTALEEHPDVILLDILMPRMDGLTMFKELRKDDWGKKAVVVLLTNLSPDDKVLKAVVEYEPAFYLIKTNWRLDDVVAKVKETVGLE